MEGVFENENHGIGLLLFYFFIFMETSKIVIREMELEDIPKVFALGEILFTAEKWTNLYRSWDEYEILERFISDEDFCLVAEQDNQIVGFTIGAIIHKRKSAWTYGYLIWIGIDPNLKNKGIGKKLLKTLTRIFVRHGARIMLADTAADNLDAIHFLHKNGFGNEEKHVYFSKNIEQKKK